MTCAGDREITPWPRPFPSGPRSAVRVLRTPGAEALRMWNRLVAQASWDGCLGEGRRRYLTHRSLRTAPAV